MTEIGFPDDAVCRGFNRLRRVVTDTNVFSRAMTYARQPWCAGHRRSLQNAT